VQVFELGVADGEHYLAMEYVAGRDLSSLLNQLIRKKGTLPPALACYLVHEVAAALGYAHALTDETGRALEIIHRDVSPSNIMVGDAGTVKLVDFGIAKAASGIRNEKTRTGVVKGKVSYMSPEQADAREIDRRSDIFSLGIVFWECLTGKRLFGGSDDLHTLRLIREAAIDPPSSVVAAIDPRIEAVVMRMLAGRREDRWASCEEICVALAPLVHEGHADAPAMQRFVAELGPAAAERVPAVDSEVVTVAADSGRVRATAEHAPATRSRRGWAVLALAGVAAAAVAVVMVARHAPSARTKVTAPVVVAAPVEVAAPSAPAPTPTPPPAPPPAPATAAAPVAHHAPSHKPARHHAAPHPRAAAGNTDIHDPFRER
jgi:hypothetical protein